MMHANSAEWGLQLTRAWNRPTAGDLLWGPPLHPSVCWDFKRLQQTKALKHYATLHTK